tara:strand:- start:1 stop:114 length:114 start_codon:yes stop_codon:yes gene_type:complete
VVLLEEEEVLVAVGVRQALGRVAPEREVPGAYRHRLP